MPRPCARLKSVSGLSSNTKIAARSPRSAAARANWAASVDLPVPAGPMISVLVPRSRPPPSSVSSAGDAARQRLARSSVPAVLGGDQPREHLEPAAADHEVVVAAAEIAARGA